MRKHGWQLPYHPLQIVAVAVFLALGFAFYVFFAPFVGKQFYQYIVMGLYTPLILCAFGLYVWCAAADPADPGVFKSKKYLNIPDHKNHERLSESKLGGESTSSKHIANAATVGGKPMNKDVKNMDAKTKDHTMEIEQNGFPSQRSSYFTALLAFFPCAFVCNCSNLRDKSSKKQTSEDGMSYCSSCEAEVFKYSKHCRVCDKCVDQFDHHCRWLNNCIGKRNYRKFFTLMVSAFLLLILEWSTGILVLIRCFVEHERFAVDIATNLGSSFTIVPYVIVVAVCTILAMIATLPIVQLFFFHILLIKKGISTYDYIVALREQEQQGVGGQQSPQMSQTSSLTGLSSASSYNTFQRGAWCTPPRLFVEDQFDVVPTDTGSVSSLGKKAVGEVTMKKKNVAPIKLSPWALARLNAQDFTKVAAEARKKSKILPPMVRRDSTYGLERDDSFGSRDRNTYTRPDYNQKQGISLAAMSNSTGIVSSSPESSLDSPDLHPFEVSSSGAAGGKRLTGISSSGVPVLHGVPSSTSTSDGYEASGGEDSDRVPSRTVQRYVNWSNILFSSVQDERIERLKGTASSGHGNNRKL